MSSRQTTTIAVLVTMRLPVGAHAADGIEYVKSAMRCHRTDPRVEATQATQATPIASINPDDMSFKLVKKETQYL